HELRRERLLKLLTLHALTAEGTADLLSALLGGADGADERVAEALVEQIQQATGGLPLFVQEVVHSLQERGEMDRRNGQWTRRTSGELDVSETVRDAIGARIERLRPETQAMLEEGSVLGQVFDVAPLQRMGAHAEAEVEAALEEALQAGLIEETARRGAHGVAYSFRHALRQRAVYTAIPSLRRRRLHRAAAEALEAVHEGKRSMPAATLAWHFLEGDAVARALPYSLKAGDQAEEVYAHAEAERHYRLAAELARELGGQPCEAEAYQKLGALCDNLGRFDEAIAALEQAARGYRMLGDRERLARATHHLVRALHRAGRITEGVGHLQALVVFLTSGGADEPSERHPDLAGPRAARALDTLAPAAAALIGSNMAVYLATLGRAVEALSVIEEATAHARIAGDVQVQVLAHYMRGNILRDLGRLDDAERAWQESSTLAREAGSLDFRAIALSNRGLAQVAHGDLAQARVLYVQALEVGTQLGDPYLVAWSRGDIAELAFIGGDWGQARTALETTLEAVRVRPPGASRAVGLTYGAGMPLALLGRLDLAEGRTEEGLLALGQVLRLSESSTASGILPWAQQALAEYDLLAGEPEAARRRLEPMFAAHGSRESALPATLAWALLELGARDQAQQVVEATTAVARARRLRLVLVEALRIQGLVALRGERWSEAEKAVEEPLALCREMGYPYAEAKARYVYGQLDAARGEREPARQHFAAALAILRRLGERLYAEHVERALAALPGVGQQEG
ncbi:MAG TPA: tetratricopeptide repeat protein, partial [Ktedonobacterales bacterium]|nr:tetratricopeptide repeat protein [Ktedonobacterales bacterium]